MANVNIIGLKELREHTDKYINKVKLGREFTVVKKSQPVFKIAPVDAWGDEGIWKTILNFKELDENGVRAENILTSLRKWHGSNR